MTATDSFARKALRLANKRIQLLEHEVADLRKRIPPRPMYHQRCSLCGEPCRPTSRFCHAHRWAEGEES